MVTSKKQGGVREGYPSRWREGGGGGGGGGEGVSRRVRVTQYRMVCPRRARETGQARMCATTCAQVHRELQCTGKTKNNSIQLMTCVGGGRGVAQEFDRCGGGGGGSMRRWWMKSGRERKRIGTCGMTWIREEPTRARNDLRRTGVQKEGARTCPPVHVHVCSLENNN